MRYGFVRKDSELGRKIFNLLSDGEEHSITLDVQFITKEGMAIYTVINDVVSEDWLERH